MPIEVIKPGLATTVQDRGREGYYHVGVPPSGGLDQFSLVAANLLVGNEPGAATLECAYQGPQLRFTEDALVAVTGAEIEPKLEGEAQPGWTSFAVSEGDLLTFGHLKRGARIYIAVAGGLDVPEVLGSRSTYALGRARRLRRPHAGGRRRAGDRVAPGDGEAGGRCPRSSVPTCRASSRSA